MNAKQIGRFLSPAVLRPTIPTQFMGAPGPSTPLPKKQGLAGSSSELLHQPRNEVLFSSRAPNILNLASEISLRGFLPPRPSFFSSFLLLSHPRPPPSPLLPLPANRGPHGTSPRHSISRTPGKTASPPCIPRSVVPVHLLEVQVCLSGCHHRLISSPCPDDMAEHAPATKEPVGLRILRDSSAASNAMGRASKHLFCRTKGWPGLSRWNDPRPQIQGPLCDAGLSRKVWLVGRQLFDRPNYPAVSPETCRLTTSAATLRGPVSPS